MPQRASRIARLGCEVCPFNWTTGAPLAGVRRYQPGFLHTRQLPPRLTIAGIARSSSCSRRNVLTLGIGAGQQSRVDCTRLAGDKTDVWWLRRHPAVRALTFRPGTRTHDQINWQVRLIEGDLTPEEKLRLDQALISPADPLTAGQRAEWLGYLTDVAFASDGFLPFRDNVDHARRHGVSYIAEPGGSIRSGEVAEACREHGITLARTGLRLFHH